MSASESTKNSTSDLKLFLILLPYGCVTELSKQRKANLVACCQQLSNNFPNKKYIIVYGDIILEVYNIYLNSN